MSDSRRIHEAIDRDLFIRNALERGLVNSRALARELRDRLGLETSLEGAVSAIRRYTRTTRPAGVSEAEWAVRNLRISTRTQVASIALRKQSETLALLPRLFNSVDWTKGEAIRVVQAQESVKVILDQGNVENVLSLVPASLVLGTKRGLAELSIRLDQRAMETPGSLLVLLSVLYAHGINVWELLMASPEVLLFLNEEKLAEAHQALMQLSRPETTTQAPTPTAPVRNRAVRTARGPRSFPGQRLQGSIH